MNRRRSAAMTGFCLVAAACGGGEGDDPDQVTISFGATISRTGSSAVDTWGNAFELAAADANEGMAMAGAAVRKVRWRSLVVDSMNVPTVAARKAGELVRSDDIKMVLNGTSADSLALNALAYEADPARHLNIPIVCVACSSPSHHNPEATDADPARQAAFRNIDRWHFGLSMSAIPQSLVLARIIMAKGNNGDSNGDGKLKVSTYNIDDPFGNGFAAVLKEAILRLRPDATIEQLTHPARNELVNDLARWIEDIRLLADDRTGDTVDGAPDIILEITFPQYALAVLKAYTAGNYKIPFLHTHSMRERTVVIQAGGALDGHEGTSYLPIDGVGGQLFDERFRKTVGLARQSQWDGHVYDGYVISALATLIAMRELPDPRAVAGAQIRDAMFKVNDPAGTVIHPGPEQFARAVNLIAEGKPINYEGASGPCDFDPNGRVLNRIAHWMVMNQMVTDLAVYDCVSNPAECPRSN